MIKSLNELRELFNAYLEQEKFTAQPSALYAPNNYILGLGGKRLRPLLVLMACELMGKDAGEALPAALAIEYFHNYTLVHDDIMDNADLRRGHETVHVKYGLNEAILSGDVLLIYAYHYLNSYDSTLNRPLMNILNKTAVEVCEGQSLDLSYEDRNDVNEEEYLEMIRLKTSVLLAAAMKIGALIGDAEEEEVGRIYEYGENLGLAFQMQDDILDTFGDRKVGKKIGGDILQNKKTLLLIRALQKAEGKAAEKLHFWLNKKDFEDHEKINAVKGIYDELAVKDYVLSKRDGYVKAAMKALDNIDRPHDQLKELVELLVLRNH